ncbi:hypothetical protein SH2C18_17560 [Clostridium sediminicola]|uniref:hypothetical protein n=1 Tax=Clostridium sediminicola TaxID=3114879 RepID=UPI0031F1D875
MKQYNYLLLLLLSAFLIGCNKTTVANTTSTESDSVKNNVSTTAPPNENLDNNNNLLNFESMQGLDLTELNYIPSEMTRDPKLEEAFAKVYDLKPGVDKLRYYYNRIDLNGDEKPETFVYLVGPSVCGTGGCSALIFESQKDEYKPVSRFTLVNNPIIISKNKTNGWNDIIMDVYGGGIERFFSELKYDNYTYPLNPSVQPKVKEGTKIQGTAIISDDITKNSGIEFK